MSVRTLVVGDVQGCADELDDLLEHVGFVSGTDQLVSVGDLVNRGPRSLEVLRRVRALGGDLVLGNHELHLLAVAAGLRSPDRDTFLDVLAAEDLHDLVDWLVRRPEPLVRLRDYVVVHAGIGPGFQLPEDAHAINEHVLEVWTSSASLRDRVETIVTHPTVRFLTHVRYCDAAGRVPANEHAMDPPGYRAWFEQRPQGPRIAFGHWARLAPARADRIDLRFLDTGCVYGGRLSGWLVEEDRLVSVPARRAYAGGG